MATSPSIRWRNKDISAVRNAVRVFNAKRTREIKKNPELADVLPPKLEVQDLIKTIETRKDYHREMKSLERFKQKDATKIKEYDNGLKLTRWEERETSYKVAEINRKRTIERKRVEQLEATTRGEAIGLKRGEMGSVRLNELKPKKFNPDKINPGTEWQKFKESVEKQIKSNYTHAQKQGLQDNYIKGLYSAFGYNDQVMKIEELISSLSAENFYKVFMQEQEATIDFIYDPSESKAKLNIIEDIWENAADADEDET